MAIRRLLALPTPRLSNIYRMPVSSIAKSKMKGSTSTKEGTLFGSMPKNNMSKAKKQPPAI